MSLELVAIVVTGVLTGLDFIVNIATLCFTGRCRSDCCGVHFEHVDTVNRTPTRESARD